ncbi:MAG: transglycosylase SLT domain-containing protein [Pseudomonadota bacterium]
MKLITNNVRLMAASRISFSFATALILIVLSLPIIETSSGAWVTEHGAGQGGYLLPPNLVKEGLFFAESKVPLERPDVHERIVDQLNYLVMDRRASVGEWFNLFVTYGPIIKESLKKDNLPLDLVYLSMLMSEFEPTHKTRSGGLGWWALGPSRDGSGKTAVPWFSSSDWDDRRDPEISTRIAAEILHGLRKNHQKQDWLITVSAFIDGVEKIDPIIKKSPGYSFWDIVTPPLSDLLIPRLIALKIIHQHRKFYCITVNHTNHQTFDNLGKIRLAKDLPLALVARWAKEVPRNIWLLNPGVDPSNALLPKADKRAPGGFPLRVPKGVGTNVKKLLETHGYLNKDEK